MRIPFAKVDCSGRELEYVRSVLESGWLTTAGKARAFEERFAGAVEAGYACAVNSCTAALHLGLEAMGVGPGDKVLVPSMTFTAQAPAPDELLPGSVWATAGGFSPYGIYLAGHGFFAGVSGVE